VLSSADRSIGRDFDLMLLWLLAVVIREPWPGSMCVDEDNGNLKVEKCRMLPREPGLGSVVIWSYLFARRLTIVTRELHIAVRPIVRATRVSGDLPPVQANLLGRLERLESEPSTPLPGSANDRTNCYVQFGESRLSVPSKEVRPNDYRA